VILEAPEELDLATVEGFTARLRSIESNSDVVVDLRALRFCGATGLSMLMEAEDRLAANGSSLTLSHAPTAFLRLLKICGLDRRFQLRRQVGRRVSAGGADPSRR
jgi:anti-sigma B factor antagonist